MRQWYEGIKQQNPGRNLSGVVVANKVDLENRVQVGTQDGQAFAESIGFEFFGVSTLQCKGVEEPFKALADMFTRKFNERISLLSNDL